ncbi:protein ripply1-like [Scyliorhinus canicula]|uniref:protein ripply1-like n=1 Tax=Scyliorhinus canicula TaxID=7830 RepID=UPI0018F6F879|nr:protein ripply1-like [Scyliorhinus canicula]
MTWKFSKARRNVLAKLESVSFMRLDSDGRLCDRPANVSSILVYFFTSALLYVSHSPLWRPWIVTARDRDRQRWRKQNSHPHMEPANQESASQMVPSIFTHPVRLMWPRNKCFDYLYSAGQELLAAFPVQASISFYVESDSEGEDEEFDEEDEFEEESAMEETVLEKFNRAEKSAVVTDDGLRQINIPLNLSGTQLFNCTI